MQGMTPDFQKRQMPAASLIDLRVALNFINQTSDVWYGWTYWAGGPLWGNYMYSVAPGKDGSEKPQMAVLKQFAE